MQWHVFSAVSVAGALRACAFAVRLPRDNGDGDCVLEERMCYRMDVRGGAER